MYTKKQIGLFILSISVLFSFTTSFANADVIKPDFNTASFEIGKVENAISTAESKLEQINSKGLDIPKGKDILERLEVSKQQLGEAKKYLEAESYSTVLTYTNRALENVGYSIRYFDAILEGRFAPTEGTKLETIENLPTDEKIPMTDKIIPATDERVLAPIEGTVKEVEYIITSDGDEKKDTEKRIIIAPLEGTRTEIKMTTGASPKDCQYYSNECKKGDDKLCAKWEFNCTEKEVTQCDTFLRECKLGDSEACEKWDLNCKPSKDNKCSVLLQECKLGDDEACNKWDLSCTEIIVETEEIVEVKDEKLYVNEKEVKIMPDTVSEIAIAKLGTLNFKIELKDIGKLVYDISGKKQVKVLGFFRKEMVVKIQISADTGEVKKIKKPWWSFLVW